MPKSRTPLGKRRQRRGARGDRAYMSGGPAPPVPVTGLKRKRLPSRSTRCISRGFHMSDSRRTRLVRGSCPSISARRQNESRRAHPQGDRERLRFLERGRPRISEPFAQFRELSGGGKPAHPARVADRLRVTGRSLCSRRALDRLHQRDNAAFWIREASARHRQHGHCGGA